MSSPADRAFDPARLLDTVTRDLPTADAYWVGFSGGLDSTVLLHALAANRGQLPGPLSAVHIDHALQPASAAWARHCMAVCDALGVPLSVQCVDARAQAGEGPEAAARTARYAAIARLIGPGAILLTAHHRDDQAETLLLQLMRGAGVDGLAAMPAWRRFADGWQGRPMLGWSRAALRDWAEAQRLHWIEDPSNAHSTADRNFLRHEVLPRLSGRWPGAADAIVRSAAHCAEAAQALAEQAAADLAPLRVADGGRLPVAAWCGLAPAARRRVLRLWLRERGAPPIPQRRLHEALDQLCGARADAGPRIAWGGVELRRFRDELWLLRPLPAAPAGRIAWHGEAVQLPDGLGIVRRRLAPGGIDPALWEAGRVELGFRTAGLRCRPAGRDGSRSFKRLAQDLGIPPWLRDHTPLLWIDGELAAVANACVCAPCALAKDRPGWWIDWRPGSAA